MAALAQHLREEGLEVHGLLGYGNPAEELVRLAGQERLDLLVLGTHGHRFLADLALGSTVAPVLHRLTIPVLVVPSGARIEANVVGSGSSQDDIQRPAAANVTHALPQMPQERFVATPRIHARIGRVG